MFHRKKEFQFIHDIEELPLTKSKTKVMKELTDFLMSFKFEIKEQIIGNDFKLVHFVNKYSFYNEVGTNIYIVKTIELTEEIYQIMLNKIRNSKEKRSKEGAVVVAFVEKYNGVFKKYLEEFCYMDFYTNKYHVPTCIYNLGVCFENSIIYIGSLNEDTKYQRGKEWKKLFSNIVKDFNNDTFIFKDKIKNYSEYYLHNQKKEKND